VVLSNPTAAEEAGVSLVAGASVDRHGGKIANGAEGVSQRGRGAPGMSRRYATVLPSNSTYFSG
jgi:hypothetical protein